MRGGRMSVGLREEARRRKGSRSGNERESQRTSTIILEDLAAGDAHAHVGQDATRCSLPDGVRSSDAGLAEFLARRSASLRVRRFEDRDACARNERSQLRRSTRVGFGGMRARVGRNKRGSGRGRPAQGDEGGRLRRELLHQPLRGHTRCAGDTPARSSKRNLRKKRRNSPSRISFHRIKPMLTHPALATAAKGTSFERRARAEGETRRRGTSWERPTAMEQEATVAAA